MSFKSTSHKFVRCADFLWKTTVQTSIITHNPHFSTQKTDHFVNITENEVRIKKMLRKLFADYAEKEKDWFLAYIS